MVWQEMMFNPRDIHCVVIGYDKTALQYRINLELLRYNMSFGDKLWITTVYNSDPRVVPSGIGENTFILQDGSRGYAYGALDAINAGLDFANAGYRDIIAVFNFDCLFFREDGFVRLIEDFIDSEKMFAAASDVNSLPATDLMLFKKEFLQHILPIQDVVDGERLLDKRLQQLYEPTDLGFNNVEEWVWNAVGCDDWHVIPFRTDLPRLRWSEEIGFGHLHEIADIKNKLEKYNCKKTPVVKHILECK